MRGQPSVLDVPRHRGGPGQHRAAPSAGLEPIERWGWGWGGPLSLARSTAPAPGAADAAWGRGARQCRRLGCSRLRMCQTPLPPVQDFYDKLPEADDDENDMLDLAFGLTDT